MWVHCDIINGHTVYYVVLTKPCFIFLSHPSGGSKGGAHQPPLFSPSSIFLNVFCAGIRGVDSDPETPDFQPFFNIVLLPKCVCLRVSARGAVAEWVRASTATERSMVRVPLR